MAIFTAIVALATAIAGAGVFGTIIVNAAIAVGGKLVTDYIFRRKARKYSAWSGTADFAAADDRWVVFGQSLIECTDANLLFYAKWGKGNKWNAWVYKLADGWNDGLQPRIRFYGQWHDLEPVSALGGEHERWTISGYEDILDIRWYSGAPDQTADAALVADTADLGRNWKSTATLRGVSYVIFKAKYDSGKFARGRPDFAVVQRGLREYDPRLDDTAPGGEGDHRLNDPSTWAWTENPAVHRYNYQIGLRGLASGRVLVGEGKQPSQLEHASYMAAMNICDAERTVGERTIPTYACSMVVKAGDPATEILREFDDAMAGWALTDAGLAGVIAGAPVASTFALGPDDIPVDRGWRRKPRRRSHEMVNHLSGQYLSPETWQPESLDTIYVNGDVTADGGVKRSAQNDFLQVTDPDIGQYLLSIRYRQNRLGASAEVAVSWRAAFTIRLGDAGTWAGATWRVAGKKWGARNRCTLSLIAHDNDIYDDETIDPGPVPATPPTVVNPSLLTTVQNFVVATGYEEGSNGQQQPVVVFTWTPPDDPSIVQVPIEYGVSDTAAQPARVLNVACDHPEAGELRMPAVPGRKYSGRATIRTVPDRLKVWTDWEVSPSVTPDWQMRFADLTADIRDYQAWLGQGLREVFDEVRELAVAAVDQDLSNYNDKQVLRTELRSTAAEVRAEYAEAIVVATGPGSALVGRIETLEAEVTDPVTGLAALASVDTGIQAQVTSIDGVVTAQADYLVDLFTALGGEESAVRFRATALSSPGDGWARFGIEVSYDDGANFSSGSLILDAKSGHSRGGFIVDEFFLWDGTSAAFPFYVDTGVTYIDNAFIRNLTADNIEAESITADKIVDGAITGNAFAQLAGTTTNWAGSHSVWNDVVASGGGDLEVTIDVADGAYVEVDFLATIRSAAGADNAIRVVRDGSAILSNYAMQSPSDDGGFDPLLGSAAWKIIDTPSAGSHTYTAQWITTDAGGSQMISRMLIVKQFRK